MLGTGDGLRPRSSWTETHVRPDRTSTCTATQVPRRMEKRNENGEHRGDSRGNGSVCLEKPELQGRVSEKNKREGR